MYYIMLKIVIYSITKTFKIHMGSLEASSFQLPFESLMWIIPTKPAGRNHQMYEYALNRPNQYMGH